MTHEVVADVGRDDRRGWIGGCHHRALPRLRPSRLTMSYSNRVAGCTDSRLPFCVTIIDSRPWVALSTASGTVAANRSTNPTSTMYQTGAVSLEAASKYLCPGVHAKGSG